MAVDADGIPLGVLVAPANRHDSPLLTETLDALAALRPLPEQARVHLDRAATTRMPHPRAAPRPGPDRCDLREGQASSSTSHKAVGGGTNQLVALAKLAHKKLL